MKWVAGFLLLTLIGGIVTINEQKGNLKFLESFMDGLSCSNYNLGFAYGTLAIGSTELVLSKDYKKWGKKNAKLLKKSEELASEEYTDGEHWAQALETSKELTKHNCDYKKVLTLAGKTNMWKKVLLKKK